MLEVLMQASLRDNVLICLVCLTLFALSLGTGPTSIGSVLLLLVCLLSGAWLKGWDWWWQQRQWLLPLLLVMLLPWLSLLWTIAPEPHLYPYLHRSHYWLFGVVAACLVFHGVRPKLMAMSLVAGVEMNMLLFVVMKLGVVQLHPLVNKLFLEKGYITYSLLLGLATVLASFLFRDLQDMRWRVVVLLLIVLNVATLAQLQGRSGYLAFVVLVPIMMGNMLGWRRWRSCFVAGTVLIVCFAFSPIVQQRVTKIGKEMHMSQLGMLNSRDTSVGTRLALWEGALAIFREHPLVGCGVNGYPVAMHKLYPDWDAALTNPHNFYLYVAASYGLLGLTLYGWLWITSFTRAWFKRGTWSGFMTLATLLVVSVGSLTETTPLHPQTGILLALMIGLPLED